MDVQGFIGHESCKKICPNGLKRWRVYKGGFGPRQVPAPPTCVFHTSRSIDVDPRAPSGSGGFYGK